MKLTIDFPHPMETASLVLDEAKRCVEMTPTTGHHHLVTLGYLTATGENGRAVQAALRFNGKTGSFSLTQVGKGGRKRTAFDMTDAEVQAQKEKSTGRLARLRNLVGQSGVPDAPSADEDVR